MILGLGTDIIEIERLSKALTRTPALAKRVLTDAEFKEYEASQHPARFLAKRFAAKEACVKAMGTGIGNGIGWQDIQIDHDTLGKPLLRAKGAFISWCETHQVSSMHISIADEQRYATACVVIEK